MKLLIHLFIISSFIIYIFQCYDIESINNYQRLTFKIDNYYKIFEFDTTHYFQDETSYINIILRKYESSSLSDLILYIYYDKEKIQMDFFNAKNYDQQYYMINYGGKILQLNLNLTNPFIYLVFAHTTKIYSFSFQIFNSNSYTKIENNYFKFDLLGLSKTFSYVFTFSFSTNKEDDYLYYLNNIKDDSCKVNMIVMDINRNILYETEELKNYYSLARHIKNGIKLLFIKMRITSKIFDFQININNDYTKYDIVKLDRKNYLFNISMTTNSEYYFLVNTTNIYDNSLYFDVPQDSLSDLRLYYYFFKTFDIDQINLELSKRNYDVSKNIYLGKYSASISNDTKCMIIKLLTEINYNDFYFKVIYHDWSNIYSFGEKDLKNSDKQYIILKFQSSILYNEDKNSIISVMIDNGNEDFYIGLYSDINDIYPEEIKNNKGNLVNGKYIIFNYIDGDKYIFVSNFNKNLNNSKITIINNKEYCNIRNNIFYAPNHNFTYSFKFDKTLNQILTLSFTRYEINNKCLSFKIITPNLKLKINDFTDDGIIKPVQNGCYQINEKKMYFELTVSSKNEFDEFQFEVLYQEIINTESESEGSNSNIALAIIIPIVLILVTIAIIIAIYLRSKNSNKKNTSYCSSDPNRGRDFATPYNSTGINQQGMYGQNNKQSIELNYFQNNYPTPYNGNEIKGNNNSLYPEYEKPYYS